MLTPEQKANQYVGKPHDFVWNEEEQYFNSHDYNLVKAFLQGYQTHCDEVRYLAGLPH